MANVRVNTKHSIRCHKKHSKQTGFAAIGRTRYIEVGDHGWGGGGVREYMDIASSIIVGSAPSLCNLRSFSRLCDHPLTHPFSPSSPHLHISMERTKGECEH